MPKPTKGPRLGGGPAHERLMLANLAAALFIHKSIKTTETRAKRLRPLAERLITFAKRGDLHARRRVLATIGDKTVVHELFTVIAPQVNEREGGYTRITKLGFRKGDNASMVQMELVLEPLTPRSKPAKSSAAKAAKPAAEPGAEPAAVVEEVPEVDAAKVADIAEVEADVVEAEAVQAKAADSEAVEAAVEGIDEKAK